MGDSMAIQPLRSITKILATYKKLPEVLDYAERVRALAGYLNNQDLFEEDVRARIAAGRLLKEMLEDGQRAGHGGNRRSKGQVDSLKTLGVEGNNAKRLRLLSVLSDEVVEPHFAKWRTTDPPKRPPMTDLYAVAKVLLGGGTEVSPAALPTGVYDVVYADPPWEYEHSKTTTRSIKAQYPTVDIDTLCQLWDEGPNGSPGLTKRVAESAVLFLWATAPKLQDALNVIDAWDFTYRTHMIWDKCLIGMGYWFRGQHELLLVGVRGKFPPPPEDMRRSSVYCKPRAGKHSEKPKIHGLLSDMTPTSHEPRLELFGREQRPGWHVWGNEIYE